MRTRVYIAGPITKGDRVINFATAVDVMQALIGAGYAPLCPHLTMLVDHLCPNTYETWLHVCLPWVAAADAVFRLPGQSYGADKEVGMAESCKIPVFTCFTELCKKLPKCSTPKSSNRFQTLVAKVEEWLSQN